MFNDMEVSLNALEYVLRATATEKCLACKSLHLAHRSVEQRIIQLTFVVDAAFAFLVYDCILCLEEEVRYLPRWGIRALTTAGTDQADLEVH